MLGQTYAADPTPGRHTTSAGLYYSVSAIWKDVSWLPEFRTHKKSEDYENTFETAIQNVAYTAFKMLIDAAGGCYYAMLTGLKHYRLFDYLNAATGLDLTPDEYIETGRRIQNLRQQFNALHGVDTSTFRPHPRVTGEELMKTGHNAGLSLKTDALVASYRKAWGWDAETGYPLSTTLKKYGIDSLLGGPTEAFVRESGASDTYSDPVRETSGFAPSGRSTTAGR